MSNNVKPTMSALHDSVLHRNTNKYHTENIMRAFEYYLTLFVQKTILHLYHYTTGTIREYNWKNIEHWKSIKTFSEYQYNDEKQKICIYKSVYILSILFM